MLEHDLMSIELVAHGPVIPNAIVKQIHMTRKAQSNSWQQLKSQKLYFSKCIVLLNIELWDVRTSYPKCNHKANSYDLPCPIKLMATTKVTEAILQ